MATDNKSPSYLRDREGARAWLTRTAEGRAARDLLIRNAGGNAAAILDDDRHVDWEDLVRENRDLPVLAASNAEARASFELARQSRSTLGPPGGDKGKWLRVFSPPSGYVLRRQIETADPAYWNDPVNLYREALANPQWCPVPADHIRGKLESLLPKARKPRPELSLVTGV